MKKELYALGGLLLVLMSLVLSCKKDRNENDSFSENFQLVNELTRKGWIFANNSSPADAGNWRQGEIGDGKTTMYGFPAYNHKSSTDEFAFAGFYAFSPVSGNLSSWMFTPAVEVKNGDRIVFYARVDDDMERIDRLQVRMNDTDNSVTVGNTPESVGKFTKLLLDINPNLAPQGFPKTWTRFDITISGLSNKMSTRFAFRYLADPMTSGGVGIDAFEFISK